MIYTPTQLRRWDCGANINGRWIPARPLRCDSIWYRLKIAYLVFTGKYDALDWENVVKSETKN